MKDIIKLSFFFKFLLPYINDRRKYKIATYNKELQQILEINLLDYKRMSGKYILGDINGKGKEYDYKENVLYEGEFLKGKRNGKGKEYSELFQLYEGEYLNGKRHGKGKEFNFFGVLIFEGEYSNGERNGKGIEHYDFKHNNKKYEGEYLNGKRHGKEKYIIFLQEK